VQAYLRYLLHDRQRSWNTVHIVVHGLRFFYHTTLKRDRTRFCIPGPRQPARLPAILSPEEIERLLAHTTNRKYRTMLLTTYAAGLRLSEVLHLRVRDIDSARMMIRVEQGKGAKDRYTLLSPPLLAPLRAYWPIYRPRLWLFPTPKADGPMHPTALQRAYHVAKRRAGITKPGGIHGLRHAFATHLLEAGVDLHTIQRLLGHGHITTTTRYFQLTQHTQMGVTIMTLEADEFLRRFLLHVVPRGFMRIRRFGLLANRTRRSTLIRCRALLGQPAPADAQPESVAVLLHRLTGIDLSRCPVCGEGQMHITAIVAHMASSPDTS
jgi:site-specific recombinase XerD